MLIIAKFTDEQYATINQSTTRRFNPRKQLTKTLRSKGTAVDSLLVVYCSSANFSYKIFSYELYPLNYSVLKAVHKV